MAAIPPWKLLILERKKKQEEDEKVRQAQADKAKLASMPAWKRAIILREKQAKSGGVSSSAPPTSAQVPSTTAGKLSDRWVVAVERVKGPDSPILKQKSSCNRTSSDGQPPPFSSAVNEANKQKVHTSVNHWSTKQPTKKQVDLVDRSKHITSIANSTFESVNVPSATKSTSSVILSTSVATSNQNDDPNLAGLPAWKRALILKKRNQRQQQQPANGEDEPDSTGVLKSHPIAGVAPVINHVSTPPAPEVRQPKVVNRVEEGEVSNQRLIEQEGITLHPPVYKEVDEWANVNEEDTKFKDLPLWKQALIKRRRADIAKRSGLPVTSTTVTSATTTAMNSNKQVVPEKKLPTSKNQNRIYTTSENKKSSNYRNTRGKATSTTRSTKNENQKPIRKAPLPPSAKKEPMFTYSFSKSTHQKLDTAGDTSSDSTDSEFEDAVITNLDDSDDGGIVLQHYSAIKSVEESSPTMGQKSFSESSVHISPMPAKKKKHLRRVSWSDTQLESKHYYPKYDYSDYEEIEQEHTKNASTSHKNSGLSQRLHPSLRQNDTNSYGYGFGSSGSPWSPTAENSLSAFVPKTLTYSPQILGDYSQPPLTASVADEGVREEESGQTVEEQDNDFYADLTSNTAALLW